MLEVNRTVLESVEPAVDGVVDAASELIGRVVVDAGARVSGSRIGGMLTLLGLLTFAGACIGAWWFHG